MIQPCIKCGVEKGDDSLFCKKCFRALPGGRRHLGQAVGQILVLVFIAAVMAAFFIAYILGLLSTGGGGCLQGIDC
jgi:hypothetical protein